MSGVVNLVEFVQGFNYDHIVKWKYLNKENSGMESAER
jgi:hypothetical protein